MKFFQNITNRGFKLIQFYDAYDELCDIQESSHVEPHIWLGTHKANPKIMASKVQAGGTGWIDYEIPEGVLISHRMHLNRKQAFLIGVKLIMFGISGKVNWYFINHVNEIRDIEIDNECSGGVILPQPIIIDGWHHYCDLVYTKDNSSI